MTNLKTVPAATPQAFIDQILESDGCVVIEGLLPSATIDLVAAEIGSYFQKAEFGEGRFFGYQTKRLGSILRKSPSACQLLAHPTMLRTMQGLLGPYCERFQLNISQAIAIHPGEPAQVLHRDDEMYPCEGFAGERMVNALWALDEFTATNGGTQLVIGSHKWDRAREPEPHGVIQAEMKKGSVLIYRGSLIHAGGANNSSAPRPGLVFGYNLGWLRQAENQYLAYPPEVAKYLPPEVQNLIGYAVHRPNLGLFECEDPAVVLQPRRPTRFGSRDYFTPEQEELLQQRLG